MSKNKSSDLRKKQEMRKSNDNEDARLDFEPKTKGKSKDTYRDRYS